MSLFSRPERRSVSYQDVWGSDSDWLEATSSDFASLVPVFAATRLLCDAVAQTPLHAYDGESGKAARQPSFLVLPSPSSTRYEWLYRLTYSLLIRGNAFGVVLGVGPDGWPTGIEWLNPVDCSVVDDGATARPVFTVRGRPVDPGLLLHVPAFPLPGKVLGLSPIKAFALTSEVGWQALRFGRDWFRNNGMPAGVLRHQKIDVIPDDTSKAIKAKFKAATQARDWAVVGKDWEINQVSVPADESQFLGTIKATANQVAAIYGVPPERIGGEAGSSRSYANLDMDLRYLRQTSVSGWLTQIEQALSRLAPGSQWVGFNMDANIRADTLTRMQAHEIALRTGIETLDEARDLEDRPPLTDEQKAAWMTAYRPQGARQETTTP